MDVTSFAVGLLPAGGFALGAWSARWRAPSLGAGIIGGALVSAARWAEFARLSRSTFEEGGAFVFLALVGFSSAAWTLRRSNEHGRDSSLTVGAVSMLGAAGALAMVGPSSAILMMFAMAMLGWGAASWLSRPRRLVAWLPLLAVVLVAPALSGFAVPARLARTFAAFAVGALLAALISGVKFDARDWAFTMVGFALGFLPWVASA